jgi:hypothetical protein
MRLGIARRRRSRQPERVLVITVGGEAANSNNQNKL